MTLSFVGYDTANKVATITPSAIVANQKYRVTVNPVVKDTTGNTMQSAYSWEFTAGAGADVTPPTVQSVAPTGASVAINSTIAITFSEPMDTASVSAAFSLKQGSTDIPGTLSFVGQTAVFTPTTFLTPSTTYTVTITTVAKDLTGNQLTAPPWSFTTEPPPAVDITAPSIMPNSNSPQGTIVDHRPTLSVTFNEPITPFYYGNINGYPTKVNIDYLTNTVTMTPTTDLVPDTYTVTIRVTDLAGNQMLDKFQWQFTIQ